MKTAKIKKVVKKDLRPRRSKDVPATKGMLDEATTEIGHRIASLELEMKSRFKSTDANFKSVDARFKEVDARFDKLDASVEGIRQLIHGMKVLVEEQNARNIFVLDGYTALSDRIDRLEGKPESEL